MKHSVASLAALLLVQLLGQGAGALTVDGRAVGPDGQGMAGARVELRPVISRSEQGMREAAGTGEAAAEGTAVTRADGRFEIAAPRAGMWTVTVRAAGFVPVRMPLLPLLEPVTLPDAELRRDAGLRVRIEDAEGRPVPGARLVGVPEEAGLELNELAVSWRPLPRRGVAGADGTAHLARTDGETLRVWAVAEGYAVAEAGPSGPGLKARLRRSPPREITVQEADGSAPAGPSGVIARDPRSGLVLGVIPPGKERTAIADGAGTVVLLETADGRRAVLLPRAVRNVRLPALAPGAGRVVDPDHQAIAGAWVWPAEEPALAVRSDAQGAYRLAAAVLTEGVKAAAPGFSRAEAGRPSLPGAALPTLMLTPAAALTGTVVDLQGRPVEGALVLVGGKTDDPAVPRAWTSAAGTFRIGALEAGPGYLMTARHSCCGTAEATVGAATSGVRLVLRPGATVTGTLVDEAGRPVAAAADVEIEIERSEEILGPVSPDAEGRFVLSSVPAGAAELHIRRSGAVPFERPGIEIPLSGTADLGRIVLPGGATLTGRVTDPAGLPLAGATIWIGDPTDLFKPWPAAPSAVSGAEGRFEILGLPAGELHAAVCHAGSFPQKLEWQSVPAQPVTVSLAPASGLRGTVVDADGKPVAGARAFAGRPMLREGEHADLSSLDSPPCPHGDDAVLTDGEGRFTLAPLEPDLYVLFVEADGFRRSRQENVEVPEAGQAERSIVLERGASVSGTVTDPQGKPLAGASLSSFEASRSEITDEAGRYRMEGVETGTMWLSVEHPDFVDVRQSLEIAAGENALDIRMTEPRKPETPKHAVRGRVLDPQGGPVAQALVTAEGALAATAPDGSFVLSLYDGTYSLLAEADGAAPGWTQEPVEVDGAPVDGVEIRLGDSAALTGRLLGLEPGELAWARVQATQDNTSGTYLGAVAADGSYRIASLGPGDWDVVATSGERSAEAAAVLSLGDRETTADLRFTPQYAVSGRAVDPQGAPVPETAIAFRSADAAFTWVTTRSDGTFELRLEDGTYTIQAAGREVLTEAQDQDTIVIAGVVVAGAPVTGLEVRLGQEVTLTVRVTGIAPEEIQSMELRSEGTIVRTARTQDGIFSFTGLSRGTWTVTVNRIGRTPQGEALPSVEMEVIIDGTKDISVEMRMP